MPVTPYESSIFRPFCSSRVCEAHALGRPRVTSGPSLSRDDLSVLFQTHGPAIAVLCRSIVGAELARDATQESFERIVRNVNAFDAAKGSFRTWAFAISRNVCRDMLRRRGSGMAALLEFRDDDVDSYTAQQAQLQDSLVAERHDVARVEQALLQLPEPMRTALVLFHSHDATYEDISKTMDVPLGTVMTWLHRGRARLRASLEKA